MYSSEIRNDFLDFFKSRGHAIVPSASLVPDDDPTLLFTNAGMNQFKKVFLGLEKRDYARAADSQKVLRVSGKHNDLEEVGKDHFHHTFFEMLGNWSFGDYYKREAIGWAWELLTSVWNLPKDRLYATVYRLDDEAEKLWKSETDIDPSHISRHGEKDNFWEMGETGPCGPCSEIHMDMGPGTCPLEGKPGHACGVNVDGCGRFIELWNLVFIQHDRQKDGTLRDLPSRHVDTGMGFERVVRVLQGKRSNYETDLFHPLVEKLQELSGREYPGFDSAHPAQDKSGMSFRAICDHARALTFAVGDGVMPSNEGRGYVIRRILRRAARHGRLLGIKDPFLYVLTGQVVDIMGQAYPDLRPRHEHIAAVVKAEEERFGETLDQGLALFDQITGRLAGQKKTVIPGSEAFKLYDTFGFPLDLTQAMSAEKGLTVDVDGFNASMAEQREQSRAARGEVAFEAEKQADYPGCIFVGYERLSTETKVTGIFRKDLPLKSAAKGETVEVTLEDTPFYGESGGQAGDVGVIEFKGGSLKVLDAVKAFNKATVHRCQVLSGEIRVGDRVEAKVDRQARLATARHHTATHLLQAALRQIVGKHVQQQGSAVDPQRLRFDFTHFAALDPMQVQQVEELVNHKVMEDLPVEAGQMKLAEAQAQGAMALFGEKYGDEVRVVSCGDFSKELCGGTHLHRTGEIGLFKIIREEAIAAGVRRIEAVAGVPALHLVRQNEQLINEVRDRLKAAPEEVIKKLNSLMEELKALEKAKNEAARAQQGNLIEGLLKEVREVREVRFVCKSLEGYKADELREVADALRKKLSDGVVVLASADEGKMSFTLAVGDRLIETKKYSAGDLAKKLAAATGGRGGGRPQLAQVGGRDDGRLAEHVARMEEYLF
jgi:alanyl-tRNA synthetase